jgi:D-amino peptidase
MAKTYKAIHPHTIAGAAVYELRINGKPHGETGVNAAVLGAFGIPTVMVTGDETTCAEARSFLGEEIQTVAVKRAVGRNAAICRPPSATAPEITAAAAKALGQIEKVKPYQPQAPFQLEVDFVTMAQCNRAALVNGVERLSPMTIAVTGENAWEQYRNLWSALRNALNEPASFLK